MELQHPQSKRNLVLLVEDNPDDRDLALIALQEAGIPIELVVCHDGEAALDFLLGTGAHSGRDTSVQPDLILLDIKLPKVDGLEVLRRARRNDPTQLVPIVILTSSRETQDVRESYLNHANSYIRKPIDFARFLETAQQVLNYWLVLNERVTSPSA